MADAAMPVAPHRRGRSSGGGAAYRLDVAGRTLAAVVGGFVLASAASLLVAALLIGTDVHTRGRAVHAGMELSWLVWTGGAMWAFHARSQVLAWAWIVGPAAAALAVALLIGFEG